MARAWVLLALCFSVWAGAQAPVAAVPSQSSSSQAVAQSSSAKPLESSLAAREDSLAAEFKVQALGKVLKGQGRPEALSSASYTPPSLGKLFLRMVLGLAVVLGLIFVLYRMARKAKGLDQPPGEAPRRSLQVLESTHVGPNQKVVLVRVGADRVLVVGTAHEEVRTLADLQGAEAQAILEVQRAQPVTPAQFSETVNQMLRRFRKEGTP